MSAAPSALASGGWRRLLDRAAIWLVLLLLLLVAGLLSEAFLRPVYLMNVVRQAAPVGIAAVGVTLVMIAGGVDLSVGAVISLAAVVAAVLMEGSAANLPLALATTLLVGAAIGLANGF
jgi:ribose transport system permease protein